MSPSIDGRLSVGDRAGRIDLDVIRAGFPILSEHVHGQPLVWFDNAATTQKPRPVIDRLVRFYERENANIHRSSHALGDRATAAYEHARDVVARFVNAAAADTVVFVRGTTEAVNLVAQSWGRDHVREGDEIVISWLEHSSNIVPWQRLAAERRARLHIVPIDDRGDVSIDEYRRLLNRRTRIVALTHASNALGTVLPIAEMTALAHRQGAHVFVDGAQAAAHLTVDVQTLGADFYAFSGHKVYGPTGIGALVVRGGLLDDATPWQSGGQMISSVSFEATTYRQGSARFEAGTSHIAGAIGLAAALEYLDGVGLERIHEHERDLTEEALDALRRVPGLRIVGNPTTRIGVLSFVIDGCDPEVVGSALDRDGIAVRAGNHCAQPALRRFGCESSVRASLALYNTAEEVGALAASLQRVRARRGAIA
jgi:cysteine desulfurase/selenocysteine lyase